MVRENRKRYIVLHILSPSGVGKGLLIKLTRDRTRDLPADEFNEIKPWFVYHQRDWAIIRTGHRGTKKMISILGSLDGSKLKEGELRLRVVGVSGTVRGAFLKLIPLKAREGCTYSEDPTSGKSAKAPGPARSRL